MYGPLAIIAASVCGVRIVSRYPHPLDPRDPHDGTPMMQKPLYLGAAVAIVLSYAVLFFLGPAATDAWAAEDQIVESLSALSLLAAAIFFFLILIKGRREGRFGTFKQIVLVGLVILFFVGAGEEISWGQRYLGLATPAGLESANTQGELNLHNLKEFSGWLSFTRMVQMFWFVFGVVLPVAVAVSKRARFTLDRLIPVLPLGVAVYLIFNQIVAEFADVINAAHPSWYEGRYYTFIGGRFEVTESVVSVLLAFGAYAVYRRMKAPDVGARSGKSTHPPSQPEVASRKGRHVLPKAAPKVVATADSRVA
jgi:hypothetical protein